MEYFVYILRSKKDGGYYVGMSGNVDKRLQSHNHRLVRSTKHRVPFEVIYTERFDNRSEARKREKHLKSYRGVKEKLSIIKHCGVV